MHRWEIFSSIYYCQHLSCLVYITRNVLHTPIARPIKEREDLVLLMQIAAPLILGKEPSALVVLLMQAAQEEELKRKKEDLVQPIQAVVVVSGRLEGNLVLLMQIVHQHLEAWIPADREMVLAIAKIYLFQKREMLQVLLHGLKKQKNKTRKKRHLAYFLQKNNCSSFENNSSYYIGIYWAHFCLFLRKEEELPYL